MPRVQIDELSGYSFGVQKVDGPEPMWILEFGEQTPVGTHRVLIPLPENAKNELVRQLSGGVIVASANGHVT